MSPEWLATNGHTIYLAVAIGTHALVGYTLGSFVFGKPWAGLVGGVVADVDLLFPIALGAPFVHRGITHTALSAGVATLIAARWGRSTAGAVGVGYGSQLLIDATTPQGIPIAFPFSTQSVTVDLGGHSPTVTAALWTAALAALWYERRSGE